MLTGGERAMRRLLSYLLVIRSAEIADKCEKNYEEHVAHSVRYEQAR